MERELPRSSENIFKAEKTLLGAIPVNYELEGRENIEQVKSLLEAGRNVIAIVDHRSLADTASGAIVAFKEGFDDLVEKAVFVIAQKYIDKKITKILINSIHIIPVISPTMGHDPRQREINKAALCTAKNLPEGTLLIMTPEAERIKDGNMAKARKESVSFWHMRRDPYIIPVAVEGTEKQWPGGAIGPIKYFGLAGFRKKCRFIFGTPVELSNIRKVVKQSGVADEKQLEVDLAMNLVADLHRKHGNPEYTRGYYDNFDQRLRESEEK